MKRLKILLCLIMITVSLSIFVRSISVEAAISGEYIYSENVIDTTCTITDYTGPGGIVEIPSTLEGYLVTSIGNDAFRSNQSLIGIIIPSGVTSIGDSAFRFCDNLTSVILPDSITSIADWALTIVTV